MFLTLALLACGPGPLDKDTYIEHYAPLACKAQESCQKTYFLRQYSDHRDCVDDTIDDYSDREDFYKECDFDKGEAEKCLDATKEYIDSCEYRDIDDECDEVWTCEGSTRPTYYYGYNYTDYR